MEARPESAEYHLLLAQVLFRDGDMRAARRETDRALEIDAESAAARELSGDLYNREGQLNLAAGEWEAAAQAGGSHLLAEKIARGRRDMAAEEGMEREISRFFAILYDSDVRGRWSRASSSCWTRRSTPCTTGSGSTPGRR